MSLVRRVAKRGFSNNFFAKRFATLNVYVLEKSFEAGAVVNEASLREKGLVNGKWDGIKILGTGELTKKLTVQADEFSAAAEAKIVAAGGTVIRGAAAE